jgi:aldose 1-epimerase
VVHTHFIPGPAIRSHSRLWVDERYPDLMLYTGDDRPDVKRRSLAEPMTCPPNAFKSGDDLIVLEPGGSFLGVWGIGRL